MCGLVGSPDCSLAIDITRQMEQRGTRTWSLTIVDLDHFDISHSINSPTKFDVTAAHQEVQQLSNIPSNPYYIIHVQSPTATTYRYHPAVDDMGYLWHNGMMEGYEQRVMEERLGKQFWDTEILLGLLTENIQKGKPADQFRWLQRFVGSFSCLFLRKGVGLYSFRNPISPQFYDPIQKTYASIKFSEQAQLLKTGAAFSILDHSIVGYFNNQFNPFGVEHNMEREE